MQDLTQLALMQRSALHVLTVNALKILNTSCLPKRPRQTAQTQIRLLLKKPSDQHLTCLLF